LLDQSNWNFQAKPSFLMELVMVHLRVRFSGPILQESLLKQTHMFVVHRDGIQTLNHRIVSRVFYHCVEGSHL
jgi:hypothetical protein